MLNLIKKRLFTYKSVVILHDNSKMITKQFPNYERLKKQAYRSNILHYQWLKVEMRESINVPCWEDKDHVISEFFIFSKGQNYYIIKTRMPWSL